MRQTREMMVAESSRRKDQAERYPEAAAQEKVAARAAAAIARFLRRAANWQAPAELAIPCFCGAGPGQHCRHGMFDTVHGYSHESRKAQFAGRHIRHGWGGIFLPLIGPQPAVSALLKGGDTLLPMPMPMPVLDDSPSDVPF